MRKFPFFIPVLFTALLLCLGFSAMAQEEDALEDIELTFEQRLTGLQKTLKEKEREKVELQQKLKSEEDLVTQEQLRQELASVEDIIVGVREDIVNISTGGAKLFSEPPVVKKKFDWQRDLELIFEPLLEQLRDISERPRLIEKLEAEIAYWEEREEELNLAVKNLESNLEQLSKKILKREVKELLGTATSRRNTAQQKLSLLRNDLIELREADNPIWETLRDIFTNVIVVLVLHFFVAIGASFLVYQVVRVFSFIPIMLIRKNSSKKTVFAERIIIVVRSVVSVVLTTMTYFVILYSFGEWLLLVFSLLIIAGLMLAMKDTVPKYFIELKTLLNMGSIRQGERIVYQGLPWRINRLNVHTRLYNSALQGHLRVPLTEIVNYSSRLYRHDEPWFPTRVGDVVFLEDGVFGDVLRQTPEIVELGFGGSIYTYQTTDFLARRPRNLSREGFTVYEIFGFDYQHQAAMTTTMLETYRQAIEVAIKGSKYEEYNTYLGVEFDNASASSLDYKVMASFTGEVALEYFMIKRLLQKASVEVANKHGWVIPFQQLTVHHQPAEQ